jgi:hypothetical protein
MTHNQNGELHEGTALAGAATGAAAGYFKNGKSVAATGALLGGLAGLFAGKTGLENL